MGKTLEKSVAKQAAQARVSALNLSTIIGQKNDELAKLIESRNGCGALKRKLKLKK